MSTHTEFDSWSAGQNYEHYMGRWSRMIAALFVAWLAPRKGADWLEVGCGTGALTQTILSSCAPGSILATDPSEGFVAHARASIDTPNARFDVANALELPVEDNSVDIITSALVMNFVPDLPKALAEARRALRPVGMLAFYVWDYPGGGMGFIDAFWASAAAIDPDATKLNESARFPNCTRDGLASLCHDAGANKVEVAPIEQETRFADFEAFWHPFTLGAGPAPGYCRNLPDEKRQQLKDHLAARLGTGGPIVLPARAWAVKASWQD